MNILWILSVGLLAFISRMAEVEAQTCGARVRRDWGMMSATEKNTYRNALRASMDSGAYIKFVEMHTEMMSELEAHRQCMFVYWHRLFLVAFENMLRGQGPQYACVTLPYANWLVASSRTTAGTCSSFGTCLSITRELGGYTSGTQRTLAINGVSQSGICVNVSPLDRFCQLSSTRGTACARCVPRSNWGSIRVPSVCGYASLRQQIFNGQNIGQMSPLVEQGCHNNVHASLGSTMGTFASPADPLFWSHHAFIDLLHTIFHKCRVGTARLTFQQKATHPVAWTSCARRNGGVFNPTDSVIMRTGERGVNPINGRIDPLIGRFFAGVPSQYAGLMDVRDLGSSSYGYAISAQLATLYNQCDNSPTSRKLVEMMEAAGVPDPSKCSVTEDGENGGGEGDNGSYDVDNGGAYNHSDSASNGGDYIAPDGTHVDGNDLDDTTGYEPVYQDDDHEDIVVVDKGSYEENESYMPEGAEDAEERVETWYDEVLEAMGGDTHENMADLERQACMYETVCLGGTQEYSEEFKAIWKVDEPRCKSIVDAINSGSQSIIYEPWREVMERNFGCPVSKPDNSTYPVYPNITDSSSSGSWITAEDSPSNDTIQVSDLDNPPVESTETTW
ncbi:hypothetical protein PHYBOEH_005902 [Phytophthora boehmeriae]|uniref:Tyrosinase copper-binding domain-containing protein n=1 Tax=Phytophthora boehmeriae TaxID=109152 RepID=A0A8T1WNJ2_9STRA|nr:hypothetical protein PHYBOEH_005902 [Phytophthora boehmeriae]